MAECDHKIIQVHPYPQGKEKADLLIIKQHMNHCVTEAFNKENGDERIDEIITLLSKVIGK